MMRADEVVEDERWTPKPLPTLRDIVAVLFRQRWVMLIAALAVVVAVLLSGLWEPNYEASMKILVRRQRSEPIVTSSVSSPSPSGSDQVSEEDLNTEVELLNSQDLLRKVVLAANLEAVSGGKGNSGSEASIAKAVRKLNKDLKIDPIRKSNVIAVHYGAGNPDLAVKVLKTLATEYTEKHLEVHRSQGEFKFFDQQIDEYQTGLERAQAKLINFTQGTGVVSSNIERDSALRQAADFDASARAARTGAQETEHRIEAYQIQLKSLQPRMTTVVRTSDNPQLMEQLKSTLLNLQLKRTALLTKFEPTYRPVQEVDQQIVETTGALEREETRPLREETSDKDPNYQTVQAELIKDRASLAGLKAREAAASSDARQYHEHAQQVNQNGLVQDDLLQAVKTQEENYRMYVQKREEARINAALDQRGILNMAIAEEPVVPGLPSRSLPKTAFFVVMLAGAFSLTAAFLMDVLDPRFRSPDEVVSYLGKPLLAALPRGEA